MLRYLTAGESHGPALTAIIEGLPAGLTLNVDAINEQLARRQRGYGRGERMKIESDAATVLSGVLYGKTTGAPLTLQVVNKDWPNWETKWQAGSLPPLTIPRPGHADYPGMIKYDLPDARLVLERASARETVMRVAVGSVARQLCAAFGIHIGSYVIEIGGERAHLEGRDIEDLWAAAEESEVRCPDPNAEKRIIAAIKKAQESWDTLGGVFCVSAVGLPVGLGSHVHWDRRLDGKLAAALMSIPAVKGVEIGPAFENARLPGSQVHDAIFPDDEEVIRRETNRAGGVEGGMSNGQPLEVYAAMKPISTLRGGLPSVDLSNGQQAGAPYQRSDVCAAPAAAVVGEAMVAWVLAEALHEKLGGDSLKEMRR